MKEKILITGASGFIGNFLVDEALSLGLEVYAIIRTTSQRKDLERKNIHIFEIDFSNTNFNENLFALIYSLPRFNYVIHNAGVTKSIKKEMYNEVNCTYTIRLINALMQQYKIPDKFLYISSLAAYGPGNKDTTDPIRLTSTPNPVTRYGKSKLEAEKFIIGKNKIPYIIIRPTAVYGPGEKDIFESIKLINKGFDFQIGTKNQHLTFIYVKDLARLVLDAIESPIINKAYFISDGNLYNSLDLGKHVSRKLEKRILHISIPLWFATIIATITELISKVSRKASALNIEKINELSAHNWNCDIQPIIDDFNFKAKYNLAQGIDETIDWYKKERWLN